MKQPNLYPLGTAAQRPYATWFPQMFPHPGATGSPCGVRMQKLAKLVALGPRLG